MNVPKEFLMKAACLLALISASVAVAGEKGSVVKVVPTGKGWTLHVNGKPFFIKGAGGSMELELLKECGGNSIRTWGVGKDTQELLDRAHKNGIMVTLGYWMGHKRHGFNYNDKDRVKKQHEKFMAAATMLVAGWGIRHSRSHAGTCTVRAIDP